MKFKKVANLLIELQDYITELKNAPKVANIEQAAARDSNRLTGVRNLEDEVMSI